MYEQFGQMISFQPSYEVALTSEWVSDCGLFAFGIIMPLSPAESPVVGLSVCTVSTAWSDGGVSTAATSDLSCSTGAGTITFSSSSSLTSLHLKQGCHLHFENILNFSTHTRKV